MLIAIIAAVVVVIVANYLLHQESTGRSEYAGLPNLPSARRAFIGIPLTGRRIIISIDAASSMNDSSRLPPPRHRT